MVGPAPAEALSGFLDPKVDRRIGVAVSGGSDSLALLHMASGWARSHGADLLAATVDHRLRPEAVDEAAWVEAICKDLGVKHDLLTWQDWNGQGNLQAEARAARYALLVRWGHENGLDVILLGHTQDDQAENFLLRLSRRAGVDGLSSMPARFMRDGQQFARPLLGIARSRLQANLREVGITWQDDPSNDDTTFDRVKARKILQALAPLGIDAETLADVSSNLSDARAALDTQLSIWARSELRVEQGDILIPLESLQTLPAEMRRRLFSHALIWISGAGYAPRRDALTGLLDGALAGKTGTLHGCLISPRRGMLRICREFAAVRELTSKAPAWDRWQIQGPWQPDHLCRALGEDGWAQIKGLSTTDLPHSSLLASPSVWQADQVIAAPLAGFGQGWNAQLLRDRAIFPVLAG